MPVPYVDPLDGSPLAKSKKFYRSETGHVWPIFNGIPRFCDASNYAESFGEQWNAFAETQIDGKGIDDSISKRRLFEETAWQPASLDGLNILEVGSGAGRFTHVLLTATKAHVHSIDFSSAVDANARNNETAAADRLQLSQASIYDLPFPDGSFDKVLCLGVLQHTPDFAKSVAALVAKAKPGCEIVVDFYPIRGWWTKVHAKYLLRSWTKRMDRQRLLDRIDRNVDWMMRASDSLHRIGLGALTRFLPLVDQTTLPKQASTAQRREWSVLDTFDMLSPEHDHPQRIDAVARMFERAGAHITFAGFVALSTQSGAAAVVRAVRSPSES